MVAKKLVKYRAQPFIGDRGELHKLGRLNHSSPAGGYSELDWTILRSGHNPDHTTLQAYGVMRWTVGGKDHSGLNLPAGVCCAPVSLEPVPPAMGCSRPPWVGLVVLPGWHGAWGNLKEISQLEERSSRLENSPTLPAFSMRRNLAQGQMGWENLFPW